MVNSMSGEQQISNDQNKVFSFLQAQLDKSKRDHDAMQMMLDQMTGFKNDVLEIRNDVVEIRNEVNEKVEAMSFMVAEVRDDIKLRDNEMYALQQEVFKKSIELSKINHDESDGDFKKYVGSYRRMIWSKLKVHFEVSRYPHIRRIDFNDAMLFVRTFNPEDYFL